MQQAGLSRQLFTVTQPSPQRSPTSISWMIDLRGVEGGGGEAKGGEGEEGCSGNGIRPGTAT